MSNIKRFCVTTITLFVLLIACTTCFINQKRKFGALTEDRISRNLGQIGPNGVAWLLSFPNSGTSYTLHLVESATQTSMATNYGKEVATENSETTGILPVIPGHDNGPFYLKPLPVPNGGYILTKTHCAAYCVDCKPTEYVLPTPWFFKKCLETSRTEYVNGQSSLTYTSYDPLIVKRAVHLFRDPFDNIVSRFRLDWKTHKMKNHIGWLADYPNGPEGIRKWCARLDFMWNGMWGNFFEEHFEPTVLSAFEGVPCHVEVYKYVQWHNMVTDMLKNKEIPMHVMHYQDYEDNLEMALYSLLSFLELKRTSQSVKPFTYFTHGDYFDDGDKLKMIRLIKFLAMPEVWKHLSRYGLQKYLDEAEVK